MEDIKIGRRVVGYSKLDIVAAVGSTNAQQILTADPNRISITVYGFNDQMYLIDGFGSQGKYLANFGFNNTPITFLVKDFGSIVTGEWWAFSGAGNGRLITVWSILREGFDV